MRYREIILEYSRAKTIQHYGEELARKTEEESKSKDLESLGWKSSDDLAQSTIEYFESIDPTKKNAYVEHFVRWYTDGSMRYLEDAPKAKPTIKLYQKFRNKLQDVDLKQMSFDQFLDLGDSLEGEKSKSEVKDEEEQHFYDTNQAEIFHDGPEAKVVIPKTKEAAQYFGRGTRWCTSANEDNRFEQYNEQGPLFIIMFRGSNEKWQLQFESQQFMDARDHDLSYMKIKSVIPIFKSYIEKRRKDFPDFYVTYINSSDEEINKLAVTKNPYCIEDISDPSEETQELAVQKNGWVIEFIENPSEEIKQIAVRKEGSIIKLINNPSEKVQKLAVQHDGEAIRYIHNPSEEIKELAVKQSGRAIKFINNPSHELQKLAVQNNGYAIEFNDNPSHEVQKLAVQQNGLAIACINNPSEEIQKLAVENNSIAIGFIRNPSHELKEIAARNND